MKMGVFLSAVALIGLCAGCASIAVSSSPALGSAHYSPTDPASVQIFTREPKAATGHGEPANADRLGQVFLSVQGHPSRDNLEQRLRVAAAKLGANGVYVVSDRLHVFPEVISGYWWGPSTTVEDTRRDIVAVAVRIKPDHAGAGAG